jgi:DNA-binding ferritin-like protein (Dps family)
MDKGLIELVAGLGGQKKQYRQYKARVEQLPPNYRAAAEALERYLLHAGGIAKGDVAVQMLGDLVDLFEQSAAAGVPIRDIVGDDPVEFGETFIANYAGGQWVNAERDRLIKAIDRAAAGEASDADVG